MNMEIKSQQNAMRPNFSRTRINKTWTSHPVHVRDHHIVWKTKTLNATYSVGPNVKALQHSAIIAVQLTTVLSCVLCRDKDEHEKYPKKYFSPKSSLTESAGEYSKTALGGLSAFGLRHRIPEHRKKNIRIIFYHSSVKLVDCSPSSPLYLLCVLTLYISDIDKHLVGISKNFVTYIIEAGKRQAFRLHWCFIWANSVLCYFQYNPILSNRQSKLCTLE